MTPGSGHIQTEYEAPVFRGTSKRNTSKRTFPKGVWTDAREDHTDSVPEGTSPGGPRDLGTVTCSWTRTQRDHWSAWFPRGPCMPRVLAFSMHQVATTIELGTLRMHLDDAQRCGWIRPSTSPAGASILFVAEKAGKLHLMSTTGAAGPQPGDPRIPRIRPRPRPSPNSIPEIRTFASVHKATSGRQRLAWWTSHASST